MLPDEDPWTEAEVATVRTVLEDEASSLRAEVARAETEIANRMDDPVVAAGDDEADTSSKVAQREQELALIENARELLEQTGHALTRIDAGTFGVCESCGRPIGKARLQAFPRATRCVGCKQRQERR